jgi:uncharacterized membrane protein YbhN (UPF0104 family)
MTAAPELPGVRRSGRRARSPRWLLANVVLPAIFTVALVVVVWVRWDDLSPIFEDPDGSLALIALLVVVGHSLNSAEFWLLYRAQGMRIGLFENWMVFTAGQLGNLLPGQVGTLYRFRYLKVVHSFAYSRSGSTFGANLVITFASSAVAGLVGLVGVAATGGSASVWIIVSFTALGLASVMLIAVPMPRARWSSGTPARLWNGFREGWEDLRGRPRVALAVLGLDLAKYLLVAWRFQVAFSLLGLDEPLWYFLVIAPAAGLAGALSFTPGGLGFREAFVTAAAVGMGSELDVGLLAATVDRGVMLATAVVLGAVGYGYTLRRMRLAERSPVSSAG